ncbi:hypothetical protein ILUMI_08389 [Ignelater luminosus]|uniref:DUF4789 domain-containing protein n=1 Tax=Ignelater luminosus TaxID=2038154 RepID=A0A8K0D7Q4_IGNLU|nr:hypothetical protein ILUMI_08389 [Ignelater luminosus]
MEIILMFTTALLALVCAQDIGFPGLRDEDPPGKQPPRLSDNRIPIHIPGRCPENQILYPGDQKHDWVCDCGPGFIYLPSADGCFAAYRKGPCPDNQILILPKGKVVPECVSNPCRTDGFVRYEDQCYELDKSGGPCKPASEGGGIFGVNGTTFALECLKDTQPLNLINFPSNCPPGSRRSASNCRPEY